MSLTHSTFIMTPTESTSPTLVLGYQATREVRTVVHAIIGRSDPDVTIAPVSLREGSLDLLYATDAEYQANEAVRILSLGEVYDLSDSINASIQMRFVVRGQIGIRSDPSTGSWIVTVGYAEVAP
jgi:hypothetical protein